LTYQHGQRIIHICERDFAIMNAGVKTAERTLDIFEAFSRVRKPLSLSHLSQLIGAPVSSCHALVQTLRASGYLYAFDKNRCVYPTRKILKFAEIIARHDPLVEMMMPALCQLRDDTKETVILGKRQNKAVVYLEVIEGRHTVRYTALPGEYKPLHSSAIGKVLLGVLDDQALESLLSSITLTGITDKTITDLNQLHADLRASVERGYFVTRGENVEDVMAIAIPVTINHETMGLAIAGPIHRMGANLDPYLAYLKNAERSLMTMGGE
jgi:IclR family acetate operon transcriptional repressor